MGRSTTRATTWAATLRHLATTAYLFNLNLLGLPMDEHYAVAPLKEDEGTRGLDGGDHVCATAFSGVRRARRRVRPK